MEVNYENNLYGKIEFLHERSKQNHNKLTIFSEIIAKFINTISDFSKTLDNLKNRKNKIIDENNSSIYNLTHFFKLNLKAHIDEFKECAEHLNLIVIGPIIKSIDEIYIKEKDLYNNYNKVKNIYNNAKALYEKSKKEFEYNAKLCEKNILTLVQLKSYEMNSNNDIPKIEERMKISISNTKTFEDKYYQYYEEVNKARENEINKQKELLKYYQTLDTDFYSKINRMISFIVPMIKKMYGSVLKSLEAVEEQCKKVNIQKDINDFIENNKSDILPDKPIEFIPYYPEASLDLSNISGNDRKDLENLDINYNVILKLYENFRDIRKDLNMEEEKKKYRLRFLCSKIFKIGPGVEFKQEDKNELISFLKEKQYKSYFLVTLSKQRTKGRYQRTETLLNDLSELINYILDDAEREKDFEGAKNCIILSQTFYFEKVKGKKKKKKYLFDYIKNNKWIQSLEFWQGLTDYMIQSEIHKNDEINKKNNYIENSEQIKSRMSNIAFSQVLSYSNTMVELKFKKEDIFKLVDVFVKKYEIEKATEEVIYENIKNTPYPKDVDEEEEEDNKDEKNDISKRQKSKTIVKQNEKIKSNPRSNSLVENKPINKNNENQKNTDEKNNNIQEDNKIINENGENNNNNNSNNNNNNNNIEETDTKKENENNKEKIENNIDTNTDNNEISKKEEEDKKNN